MYLRLSIFFDYKLIRYRVKRFNLRIESCYLKLTNVARNGTLEGQASYAQKTFRKKGKLRTCSKITPPHLKFSSRSSLCLHVLDSLLTFSSMEKVRAFRLEDRKWHSNINEVESIKVRRV